jgi:hypothetical protein
MKNILDVLTAKEAELTKLQTELSALYTVVPLLAEPSDPQPAIADVLKCKEWEKLP